MADSEAQPNHATDNTNPSKYYNHFLFKAIIVTIFLVLLPLFPSQSPESGLNQPRTWEILQLIFVGIAVSYGLFSKKSDEILLDKENGSSPTSSSKFDNAQSYVSRLLHVSSVFDDESEDSSVFSDDNNSNSNSNKIFQTWNNQYHREETESHVHEENLKSISVKTLKVGENGSSPASSSTFYITETTTNAMGRLALSKDEKWIKHYSSSQKILLVGEGDFSFSASLATAFGSASNMIATSLDSRVFLAENYDKAVPNIRKLKRMGCEVILGVDVYDMAYHPSLEGLKFDRIVFNFPFVGLPKKSRTPKLIRHQALVMAFLENAVCMIRKRGEIHITHKTNGFHRQWDIPGLAYEVGLKLVKADDFSLDDYPGYNTKRGFGGDENFNCYPSQTYMFRLY